MTPPDLLANVTEKDFQQQVLDLARLLGWAAYHTHDSRRSAPGFPDLVLVRGRRLLFVECKTEKGRLSAAQCDWLAALGAVGSVKVAVWRPRDRERIERELMQREETT